MDVLGGMDNCVVMGSNVVAGVVVDKEGPVEIIDDAASMLCIAQKSLQAITALVLVVIRYLDER